MKWTPEAICYLVKHYPDDTALEIAAVLDIKARSIYAKAKALGLKKSEAFMSSGKSGRLDGVKGKGNRFPDGHTPWNKGMKGLQTGGTETQFKPGQLSKGALMKLKPVGFERITRDGYLERKIRADGALHKRWRLVHLLNWETINGPVPAGHCLTFIDGNKLNVAVENLQLITRKSNMLRNSLHNYPEDITHAIQVRAALNRRINREQKLG